MQHDINIHDNEFKLQFENCTLSKDKFGHRGHLRIAWIYLSLYPFSQALELITSGIKRYAASLGASHIYHETLTQVWAKLVNKAIQKKQSRTFEDFLLTHPFLLDKSQPLNYYSQNLLDNDNARTQWIEPDLRALN